MGPRRSDADQPPMAGHEAPGLMRYGVLAVITAVVIISMKMAAAVTTGSVGLLSDALESMVNLVAAVVVVISIKVASRPPDESHHYGHGKVEYFAAGAEGLMILAAAAVVIWTAASRLLEPRDLERIGFGLALTVVASLINLAVAMVLVRAGKRHRSITLEADGRHLLTDVWTSAGVVAGLVAVALTGWRVLDPLIAIAVGINIVVSGVHLVRRSTGGLMDAALAPEDLDVVEGAFDRFRAQGIEFHALRTRSSGRHRLLSVHVLVPGAWTVQRSHDLTVAIEDAVAEALPGASLISHVEPIEDPVSYEDGTATLPPPDLPIPPGASEEHTER